MAEISEGTVGVRQGVLGRGPCWHAAKRGVRMGAKVCIKSLILLRNIFYFRAVPRCAPCIGCLPLLH